MMSIGEWVGLICGQALISVALYRRLRSKMSAQQRKMASLHEKQAKIVKWIGQRTANEQRDVSKVTCLLEQLNAGVLQVTALTERMEGNLKQIMNPPPAPRELDARRLRIVINTLPKVGSSSMVATLRAALPDATVDHTHSISIEGQSMLARDIEASADGAAKDALVFQLRCTMAVRPELDRLRASTSCGDGLYFICGVREPIAWALSTLFQLLDMGAVPVEYAQADRAQGVIMDWFSGRPLWHWIPEPGEWMHREIQGYLGVDPREINFDRQRGYQVVETNRGQLLFLRLENFDRLPEALGELLTAPANLFKIERENVAENKELGALYKGLMDTLRFPPAFIEKVYAAPYAMTFYSDEDRQKFAKRWSL